MPDAPDTTPRFNVGDHVTVVTPTTVHRGKQGAVIEVLEPPSDLIYRVRFPDGTSGKFFDFELKRVGSEP